MVAGAFKCFLALIIPVYWFASARQSLVMVPADKYLISMSNEHPVLSNTELLHFIACSELGSKNNTIDAEKAALCYVRRDSYKSSLMWGHDFPMLSCGRCVVGIWIFQSSKRPDLRTLPHLMQTPMRCLSERERRKYEYEGPLQTKLFHPPKFFKFGSGIGNSGFFTMSCVHVGTLQTNCYPKFNSIKTELQTLNTDSHSVNIFSILSLNLHLSQLSQRQRKQKCYTNTDKLATVFMRVPFGQNYFIFQNWVSVEDLK